MRNIFTFVIGLLLVIFSIFCGLIYIEIIIVNLKMYLNISSSTSSFWKYFLSFIFIFLGIFVGWLLALVISKIQKKYNPNILFFIGIICFSIMIYQYHTFILDGGIKSFHSLTFLSMLSAFIFKIFRIGSKDFEDFDPHKKIEPHLTDKNTFLKKNDDN